MKDIFCINIAFDDNFHIVIENEIPEPFPEDIPKIKLRDILIDEINISSCINENENNISKINLVLDNNIDNESQLLDFFKLKINDTMNNEILDNIEKLIEDKLMIG